MIDTENYKLCCLLKYVAKCTSQKPWYFSCGNLIGNNIVKHVFYIISITILNFNYLSFIAQSKDKFSYFELLIKSINVINALLGISMGVLLAADLYYGNNFPMYEASWRSSTLCFFSFSLTILHSILSALLLMLVSFQRYLVVIFPLEARSKDLSMRKYLVFAFIFSIILTTIVTILMNFLYQFIPLGICTPFVDPTNSVFLIKIITWFVVVLQSTANVVIILAYTYIYKELQSGSSLDMKEIKKQSYQNIGMQLVITTISNIFCWMPSGVIFFISIYLHYYPLDLIMWTIAVIVPLNSLLNPFIFNFVRLKHVLNTCLKYF